MPTSFELMDFTNTKEDLTGKIAAVYTMHMGAGSQEAHPTIVLLYTKCGNIAVGHTHLMQGRIPNVEILITASFEGARKTAQDLLNKGYKLNKAWM